MNNVETIEKIYHSTDKILESLGSRTIQEFKIKDLTIDNGVFLHGSPIRGKALTGVMSTLRVYRNFTDASKKMSPEDWTLVADKLKSTEAETRLYAKSVTDESGNMEISQVYRMNPDKKRTDDASYRQYINWICDSLAKSDNDISLKDFRYASKDETMDLVLINNDKTVDAFKTGVDLWKMGDRFSFNGLQFNYAPFFERLICSNGNIATEYGFGANISQAKFNNQRVQNVIEKAILQNSDKIPSILQESVAHLTNNNISISEFYAFQRFFDSRNDEGKYDSIIGKFFNDQPFMQAYGLDVKAKSRKWQSTANSGINAYNFFNMLTWIASHPADVRMDSNDRVNLQIAASSLLFKKELDLEDIAVRVPVVYPVLPSMN
jgi:hypothetical protein